MVVRIAIVGLVALGCAGGCKKDPSYDMGSPEATLASFERAIGKGQIPEQVARLVSDEVEQKQWRLRCASRGCRKATFEVVGTRERTQYTAVLEVDFRVEGDLEGEVMAGTREPIRFELDGERWFIARIGSDVEVPMARPVGRKVKPLPADAAPPSSTDAGVDAG